MAVDDKAPTSAEPLAIGLVGYGYWGPNVLRNFRAIPEARVVGVCETNAATRDRIRAEHPDLPLFESFADLLRADGLEAVSITTPAATHGKLVRQALEAGMHVLVEKPLCLDLAEADRLKAQAESLDRVLMVGHLLLYHPAFDALMSTVRGDQIGRLRYIYSNRLSLGKIRREENALWSFAPHDISMILKLVGRLPERVTATGGQYLHDGIADTTLSHLSFADGVQAHIFVSWLHPYKDHRMVVIGDSGMAVFDDVQPGAQKLSLYRHEVGWRGEIPLISKSDAEPIPYDSAEPLRRECEAFIRAVRTGAPPPSDATEGINVLRVLDLCQRSINDGKEVRFDPRTEEIVS